MPPDELEFIGGKVYHEWFNGNKVPVERLGEFTVIYIYKNPIKSIMSRFWVPAHREHVQTDVKNTINDVIEQKKDLFGIYEFYNNYTREDVERNYKIYCVKYEDFFGNIEEFNRVLGLPKRRGPGERTTKRDESRYDELYEIYGELIEEMDKMPFIKIV